MDLSNSDKSFLKMMDEVETGIYWKDVNGIYHGCNKHMVTMFGLENQEQIIGKADYELWDYPLDKVIAWAENDKLAMVDGTCETQENRTVFGQEKTFSIVKNRLVDNSGSIIGLVGFCTAIKEKKNLLAQKVSDNDLNIAQIAGLIDTGIFWKDKEGRYLGCNYPYLNMLGLKFMNQLVGKTDEQLRWKNSAARLKLVDEYVLENGSHIGEESLQTEHGTEAIYLTVKKQMVDEFGNVIGLTGTMLDVTALREAEHQSSHHAVQQMIDKELREQRESATFMKKIIHDINSPLASLAMVISALPDIPDELRAILSKSIERIGGASKELRSYYMMKNASETPLAQTHSDIKSEPVMVSAHVLSAFAKKMDEFKEKRIGFTHRIDANAQFAFIQANNQDWPSLLSNLLDNACTALNGKEGKVHIDLKIQNDEVVLVVADTGIGMPHFIKTRVLQGESLADGSFAGRGMGLLTLTNFLKKYNGKLEIDSAPSDGARITIKFAEIPKPDWALTALSFSADQIVVVVGEDPELYASWNSRLTKILNANPRMKLLHFAQINLARDYLATLSNADMQRLYVLADSGLLNQELNELENELDLGLSDRAVQISLMTSQFDNAQTIAYAKKFHCGLLVKQLISYLPIQVK